jgi:DNA-binding CsgD family transcriptional regulator
MLSASYIKSYSNNMSNIPNLGNYSKSFITDVPADLTTKEAQFLKQTVHRFPLEAIYIYSFKDGKMLYADGWEDVVGYKDDEITMLKIVMITSPEFTPFVNELNDKALMFIHKKSKHLDEYSFLIEQKKIHRNGTEVPIVARVGVHEYSENGVISIIGRFQLNNNLRFGKVMRYAVFGPNKNELEEELNKTLFYKNVISNKERDALALIAKGYSLKEAATMLNVSQSAVEKRIIPLYKRFDVKSMPHLVSFAYENHILP